MVRTRRKTSRAVTKQKRGAVENMEDGMDMNSKISIDEYETKVKDIISLMEDDKKAIVLKIETLYLEDEQRTPSSINDMLWVDYLQKNNINSPISNRKSVAAVVGQADSITLTGTVKRRGRNPRKTPVCVEMSTRTLRSRTLSTSSSENETPITGKTKKRSSKSTPRNQRIPLLPKNIITPKFDFKTPLPPSTVRKAQAGEILVSFQGSPVQPEVKKTVDISDLDLMNKNQLKTLMDKVNELLIQNN